MKHKIFFAALAALAMNTFADPGVILRGGINFANSTFDPSPAFYAPNHLGPNFALLLDIPRSEILHLLVGGGFESRGYDAALSGGTATVGLNYLTLPLMLSFQSPSLQCGRPVPSFFLNVGGEFAFLISANAEYNGASQDISDQTNGFDLGVTVEAGGQFPLNPTTSLIMGGGYTYGVRDWAEDGSSDEGHNSDLKLFAGLRFAIPSGAAGAPAAH